MDKCRETDDKKWRRKAETFDRLISNALTKHTRNVLQRHLLHRSCPYGHRAAHSQEDFLQSSHHPAVAGAQFKTALSKEKAFMVLVLLPLTMLESVSQKLLSIFISCKIILYDLEKQEQAESHPHQIHSLLPSPSITQNKRTVLDLHLSFLSDLLARIAHYLCPCRDYQQKRQNLIYLIFFPYT